jgi:hypothetical protein
VAEDTPARSCPLERTARPDYPRDLFCAQEIFPRTDVYWPQQEAVCPCLCSRVGSRGLMLRCSTHRPLWKTSTVSPATPAMSIAELLPAGAMCSAPVHTLDDGITANGDATAGFQKRWRHVFYCHDDRPNSSTLQPGYCSSTATLKPRQAG